MNKQRKVDLLYKKARGLVVDATSAEKAELRKYKVDSNEDSFFATKTNISSYVYAVDNGSKQSFYDWCFKNNKADRRRKGGSVDSMESYQGSTLGAGVLLGVLFWGSYFVVGCGANILVGGLLGGVISFIFTKMFRRMSGFLVFLLPIILYVLKFM